MPRIIIFTGPSGVGKATIEKELFLNKSLGLELAISATTRKPRKNEIDGQSYFFITKKEFQKRIQNNDFVEWNEHFSHFYGTLWTNLNEIMKRGLNPVLEIDVEGAKKVISKFSPDKVLTIFIAPPKIEDLKKRIKLRGSENKLQIAERLARVEKEMACAHLFNYQVVNDTIVNSVNQIVKILKR